MKVKKENILYFVFIQFFSIAEQILSTSMKETCEVKTPSPNKYVNIRQNVMQETKANEILEISLSKQGETNEKGELWKQNFHKYHHVLITEFELFDELTDMEVDLPQDFSVKQVVENKNILEEEIGIKPSPFDFDIHEVDADQPIFLKTQSLKTYSRINNTEATDMTLEEFQLFGDLSYKSQSKEEEIPISSNDALMKEISNLRFRIQKLKDKNLKLKHKIKNPDLSIIHRKK